MKKLSDSYIMNNGGTIPCVGFGTYLAPSGDVAFNSVKEALSIGYRHIDTAAFYKNEESVGAAVRDSDIAREHIFVTSKVWNADRGYDKTMAAFELTMKNLGLDYLDLYLIHWPANAKQFENWEEINLSTWKAMTELYNAGSIKSIGVSNFQPKHLRALMDTEVVPMVNQIEFHPGFMQKETLDFCHENNIVVEAWSPLGRGKVLTHETLTSLAQRYAKTPAQICLRWCLQHNTLPLPKSVTHSRILENADIFDFILSDEDMMAIDAVPFCGGSGYDSDNIDF